ncbi:uncharacterized protein Dere_GG20176 [Drosophila erecta]|uniref:Uncharacterized protein n=1 Tax=Drosophila erecta TaxID=7220 RepID=B3NSL6_DROER|nr:uncharacterized protein Dere_GG20176 [Drosophila erecta]
MLQRSKHNRSNLSKKSPSRSISKMRLILLSIAGLLCLAYAFALNDNGASNLEDLANLGAGHAESGVREARGYGHGNYGHGSYGHGHGGGGGHGHGHYGGGGYDDPIPHCYL